MRQLLQDLKQLWREQFGFKVAVGYLLFLFLLILLLPILPKVYNPNELDLQYTFARPFAGAASHWFGTDALGRDVLANILYGARSAFIVSLPVMLLSSIIGLAIGMAAGYFGDNGLKLTRAAILVTFTAFVFGIYYALYLPFHILALKLSAHHAWAGLLVLALLLSILYFAVLPLLKRLPFAASTVNLPLDYFILRLTEALTSIPRLLLILALASFLRPSVLLLCLIFIATIWTTTARMARAETLKIKSLPYFESARSIGASSWRLLFWHAFPNMLGPIVVTFTFGVAGLLILESTLSFLGIGIPGTYVSWGRIISGIRSNTSAWWLVVFPGVALTATVWALQTLSYHLLNLFESRKQV